MAFFDSLMKGVEVQTVSSESNEDCNMSVGDWEWPDAECVRTRIPSPHCGSDAGSGPESQGGMVYFHSCLY